MQELTNAQETVLNVLWEIKEGAIADVIAKLPEPKPAYTTVATVIKVLEKKQYVSHKSFGKTNVFFPIVEKEDYASHIFGNKFRNLFNNSARFISSFFTKNNDLTLEQLEELHQLIGDKIEEKKK